MAKYVLVSGPTLSENWIGIQIGLETGSDELANRHMPNKTLPLHIGADSIWAEIVFKEDDHFIQTQPRALIENLANDKVAELLQFSNKITYLETGSKNRYFLIQELS